MRKCPEYTPSGLSIGTTQNVKYFLNNQARRSCLSSRNSRKPSSAKLAGVSPGCTRALTRTTGLLLLNLKEKECKYSLRKIEKMQLYFAARGLIDRSGKSCSAMNDSVSASLWSWDEMVSKWTGRLCCVNVRTSLWKYISLSSENRSWRPSMYARLRSKE